MGSSKEWVGVLGLPPGPGPLPAVPCLCSSFRRVSLDAFELYLEL